MDYVPPARQDEKVPSPPPTLDQQAEQQGEPNAENPRPVATLKDPDEEARRLSLVRYIEKRFAERGATHLLSTIPPVQEMDFRLQDVFESSATPAKLYLGKCGTTELFAYMFQFGDKPREIRFYGESNGDLDPRGVLADDLQRFKLVPPFEKVYTTGCTVERRAVAILIKWYFLNGGYFSDGIGGGLEDYCYRMILALEKFNNKVSVRGGRRPEPKPVNPDGLSDKDLVHQWLAKNNEEDLLQEFPALHLMLFKEQSLLEKGANKKLFIGTSKDNATEEVYVYLHKQGNNKYHEVAYYMEGAGGRGTPRKVLPEFVFKSCTLVEPFKWMVASGNQYEKARMSAVLKYYFSIANIIGGICEETKNYPYRISEALKNIRENRESRQNGKPIGRRPKYKPKGKASLTGSWAAETPTSAINSSAQASAHKALFNTSSSPSDHKTTILTDETTVLAGPSQKVVNGMFMNPDLTAGSASEEPTHRPDLPTTDTVDDPMGQHSDNADRNITGQVEAQIQQDMSGSVCSPSQQPIFHIQLRSEAQSDSVVMSSPSPAGASISRPEHTSQARHSTSVQKLGQMQRFETPLSNVATPPTWTSSAVSSSRSSRKRTIEDMEFEEMRILYDRESLLTQQLNMMDEQIEMMQMQREALQRQRIEHRALIHTRNVEQAERRLKLADDSESQTPAFSAGRAADSISNFKV